MKSIYKVREPKFQFSSHLDTSGGKSSLYNPINLHRNSKPLIELKNTKAVDVDSHEIGTVAAAWDVCVAGQMIHETSGSWIKRCAELWGSRVWRNTGRLIYNKGEHIIVGRMKSAKKIVQVLLTWEPAFSIKKELASKRKEKKMKQKKCQHFSCYPFIDYGCLWWIIIRCIALHGFVYIRDFFYLGLSTRGILCQFGVWISLGLWWVGLGMCAIESSWMAMRIPAVIFYQVFTFQPLYPGVSISGLHFMCLLDVCFWVAVIVVYEFNGL